MRYRLTMRATAETHENRAEPPLGCAAAGGIFSEGLNWYVDTNRPDLRDLRAKRLFGPSTHVTSDGTGKED